MKSTSLLQSFLSVYPPVYKFLSPPPPQQQQGWCPYCREIERERTERSEKNLLVTIRPSPPNNTRRRTFSLKKATTGQLRRRTASFFHHSGIPRKERERERCKEIQVQEQTDDKQIQESRERWTDRDVNTRNSESLQITVICEVARDRLDRSPLFFFFFALLCVYVSLSAGSSGGSKKDFSLDHKEGDENS